MRLCRETKRQKDTHRGREGRKEKGKERWREREREKFGLQASSPLVTLVL